MFSRWHANGENGIIACSALRESYRAVLRQGSPLVKNPEPSANHSPGQPDTDLSDQILFLYLKGSKDVIGSRIGSRKGHFMPLSLLDSQFATLEEPTEAENHVTVDVTKDIAEIVEIVSAKLGR